MRTALVVAGNELRRRLRDRSAWVMALVAPFVLATIIAAAIGSGGDVDATILVVDADGSAVTQPLAEGLVEAGEEEAGGVEFRQVDDAATAQRLVRDGDAGAAVVLPAGFTAGLSGADPVAIRVLRHPERPVAAAIARAVADGIAARAGTGQLAVRTVLERAGETGASIDAAALADVARAAGRAQPPVSVADSALDDGLDLVAYFAPAMGILFLFFTVGYGARTILAERQDGTLTRLRSAPVSGASILAGKAAAAFTLGLGSLLALWGITTLAFGASWGDPVAVVALCVATVLAVAGITAVLATFATSEQQVGGMAAMVTFLFALLGGNFVTPGAMPALLRRLSLLTPNGWALRGFTELAAQGSGLGDVLVPVGVLAGLAAVTIAIAAARAPRLLSS